MLHTEYRVQNTSTIIDQRERPTRGICVPPGMHFDSSERVIYVILMRFFKSIKQWNNEQDERCWVMKNWQQTSQPCAEMLVIVIIMLTSSRKQKWQGLLHFIFVGVGFSRKEFEGWALIRPLWWIQGNRFVIVIEKGERSHRKETSVTFFRSCLKTRRSFVISMHVRLQSWRSKAATSVLRTCIIWQRGSHPLDLPSVLILPCS